MNDSRLIRSSSPSPAVLSSSSSPTAGLRDRPGSVMSAPQIPLALLAPHLPLAKTPSLASSSVALLSFPLPVPRSPPLSSLAVVPSSAMVLESYFPHPNEQAEVLLQPTASISSTVIAKTEIHPHPRRSL